MCERWLRVMEDHVTAQQGWQGDVQQPGAAQTQPLNKLPSLVSSLTPGNHRMFQNEELKNGSFPGLDLLERPPWSVFPTKAMLTSVVGTTAPGHDVTRGPCLCLWSCHHLKPFQCRSVLLPRAIFGSMVLLQQVQFVLPIQDCADIRGPCYHRG